MRIVTGMGDGVSSKEWIYSLQEKNALFYKQETSQ